MAWCFSTRASVATVVTTRPCVSRCLKVTSLSSILKPMPIVTWFQVGALKACVKHVTGFSNTYPVRSVITFGHWIHFQELILYVAARWHVIQGLVAYKPEPWWSSRSSEHKGRQRATWGTDCWPGYLYWIYCVLFYYSYGDYQRLSSELTLIQHPSTKWPPFCRRHFQMHFHEWKVLNFDLNFTEIRSWRSNWK